MSRRNVKIIAVVLGICLLGGLIYQGSRYLAYNFGTVNSADLRPKDLNAELGTPENPFTVLEIVPSREEAQIGYFIPGCEPVDMEQAKYNMNVKGEFTSTLSSIYDISDKTEYAFYDQIPAETGVPVNTYNDVFKTRTDLTYTSEYKNYGMWRSAWQESYSQKGDWVEQAGGGFRKYDWSTDYSYVGAGQGEYAWVPSEDGASVRRQNNGDLFCYDYIEYKHKDQFIQAAFPGADSESFESQVITMTPAELEQNLDLIDVADMITIHPGSGNYSGIARIYNELNTNGDHMDSIPNTPPSFWDKGKDLTYSEVMRITERMASDNPAALMLDKANMFASDDAKKEYNVHKLLYMVLTFKPEVFWSTFQDYLKPYTGADGTAKVEYTKGDKSGAYPAYRFWGVSYDCDKWSYGGAEYGSATNPFLFHPTSGACMISDIRYYNINGGGYDIFDKIFTFHGDQTGLQVLLGGGTIKKTSMEDGGLFANNCTSDAFVDENEDADSLTNMQAVEFILSQASYTPKLRILEIQPCDEFIYGSEGWKDYYQALFPWYHPKSKESSWLDDKSLITITTMPTWEFIGSTGRYDYDAKDEYDNVKTLTTESSDDLLAKYDLIIIGSNQDASNGANGYNEYTDAREENRLDLGNLIYTSIGGTFSNGAKTESMNNAGLTEVMDIRHPGNDITLKKLLELQDFLRAGKPIVADDGLYTNGNKVDTAKVDKSSKIYDLLTWNKAGSENIFIHDHISSSKMKRLISQNLCRLEFYEAGYPLEYNYTKTNQTYFIDPSNPGATSTAEGVITREISRNEYDSNGNPILSFHFFIRGKASDTYNVLLNLDLNGDGVFSGSLKEHAEVDNMNAATGSNNSYDMSEKALKLEIYDASGKHLGTTDPQGTNGFKLMANTEYQATYKLASNQQGMIPWKLEVQSTENQYRRSSAVDYTVVSGKSKEPIHVLQMNLQPDMRKDSSVVSSNYGQDHNFTAFTADSIVVRSGEDYEAFDRRNPDGTPEVTTERLFANDGTGMNEYQRQTVAKFKTYIAPVQEFSVDIQYLFNSDWYQLFGTEENSGEKYEKALDDWKDFLADYDMLVFGFVDGSLFTSNTVFAEGVKDFVAQGKSMILSHDTVIGSNNSAYGDYNSWLRTASGQRRSYYNKKTDGTYEKSYTEVTANGKKISFASDFLKNHGWYKNYLNMLTATVDGETVDARFYNTLVNEWPDNDSYLETCAQATFKDGTLGSTERVTKDGRINDLVWEHPFSRQTTFVKLTNNGQITTYPYKLGDVIEVLSTHTQYYQLDLEYQQFGDVNVWFNLSDMHDSDVQKYCADKGITGTNDQKLINMYSAKDQDCRNSFYIYNKGNITYTGSGHGEGFFGQRNALMTDDEVKLFVNTMIAAYRQPESRPYAVIDNADATTADGTGVFYLDYDGDRYETETESEEATQTAEANPNPVPLYGAPAGAKKNGLDGRVVTIDGVVRVGVEFSIHDISGLSELTDKKYYIRLSHEGQLMTSSEVIVRKLNRDAAGNVTESEITQLGTADRPYYQVDASDAGVSYIMYVPYENVTEGDGIAKYTVGTYATYTKSGRFVTTTTSNTDAQVMLMPLFELN